MIVAASFVVLLNALSFMYVVSQPTGALTARAVSPTSPNCTRTYTVQPGDICNAISAKENVSTFQLAEVNAGVIDPTCQNLFVGEVLCLGVVGQDCTTVTVVQPNDSCESIITAANITLPVLLHNNPNVNATCGNIGIGEVLCTASQEFPYPV